MNWLGVGGVFKDLRDVVGRLNLSLELLVGMFAYKDAVCRCKIATWF